MKSPIFTVCQIVICKGLVRSRLDCYHIVYHIPGLNSQTNLGVTLNEAALLLLVPDKYQTDKNFAKNWDGRPYLTTVDAGAFFRFRRLIPT